MFLTIGAIFGFLSVGLGAFGAHGLKAVLDEYHFGIFKTAVEYQFLHTFALLTVGMLNRSESSEALKISGYSFLIGILIFSGSLYLLTFTKVKAWGAVTPLGGVALMVGWIFLAYHCWKR